MISKPQPISGFRSAIQIMVGSGWPMNSAKRSTGSPNRKSMRPPTQRLSVVFFEDGYQLMDSCQMTSEAWRKASNQLLRGRSSRFNGEGNLS
ncbi:hypothetical protein CO674_06085 [Rhizobium hidalgonense]|uniref:DUF982 domain-containing protein n=1 Tax=Rhizobium hidalgonense TaxID=1538159 RepID=A0ABX4JW05_9HYPH|nr:hypothetical protein CO674_06085 [Rhizobium hidalgonense]PON04672.1 hypothetical protein ATY29_24640 [Rhizobium hidalgonense]